jgi:transcription factor C subunit 6
MKAKAEPADGMDIDQEMQDEPEEIPSTQGPPSYLTEQGDLRLNYGSDSDTHAMVIPRGSGMPTEKLDAKSRISLFNTGGYNYCAEFCPQGVNASGREYFVVSTSYEAKPRTTYGAELYEALPGMLQIWSISPTAEAAPSPPKLEMVLHVDMGSAWNVQWCPSGDDGDRTVLPPYRSCSTLGILAGAFMSGELAIFAIPDPDELRAARKIKADDTLHIRLTPLLVLDPVETTVNSLDWCSPSRIAAGCANGYVAIWDIEQALEDGEDAAPMAYFRCHETVITAVRWIMHPPSEPTGDLLWDGMPHFLSISCLNGSVSLVDLRDVHGKMEPRISMAGRMAMAGCEW